MTVGHFTILLADQNGTALFSKFDPVQPYSPPGIARNPAQGYYDGGLANRNDLLVWAYRPLFNSSAVGNNTATFGFQLPAGFPTAGGALASFTLRTVVWQSVSPPKFANSGYNMYFTVSRNEFRSWNGAAGSRAGQFDRQSSHRIGLTPRGQPASQPPFASVALSSDPVSPMVFGAAATARFFAFDTFLNITWEVTTTSLVRTEARVSLDDTVVYFVQDNGVLRSYDVATGTQNWEAFASDSPILAEFAQSADGAFLYFGDVAGNIIKWRVSIPPTSVPSSSPSGTPPTGGICSGGLSKVVFNVAADFWGAEIGTELRIDGGAVIFGYSDYASDVLTSHEECLDLSNTCYSFNITDSLCDGLFFDGYYSIVVDGNEVHRASDYGCGEVYKFGSCGGGGGGGGGG